MLEQTDDIGIKSTTQTAVRGINHQGNTLYRALHVENRGCVSLRSEESLEDMLKHRLVGKHVLNHLLSMMELRGSYHLHGTRNLTGAVD